MTKEAAFKLGQRCFKRRCLEILRSTIKAVESHHYCSGTDDSWQYQGVRMMREAMEVVRKIRIYTKIAEGEK